MPYNECTHEITLSSVDISTHVARGSGGSELATLLICCPFFFLSEHILQIAAEAAQLSSPLTSSEKCQDTCPPATGSEQVHTADTPRNACMHACLVLYI